MLTQEQAQGLNIQQHELEDAELQQAKAQKEVDRYYEAIQKASDAAKNGTPEQKEKIAWLLPQLVQWYNEAKNKRAYEEDRYRQAIGKINEYKALDAQQSAPAPKQTTKRRTISNPNNYFGGEWWTTLQDGTMISPDGATTVYPDWSISFWEVGGMSSIDDAIGWISTPEGPRYGWGIKTVIHPQEQYMTPITEWVGWISTAEGPKYVGINHPVKQGQEQYMTPITEWVGWISTAEGPKYVGINNTVKQGTQQYQTPISEWIGWGSTANWPAYLGWVRTVRKTSQGSGSSAPQLRWVDPNFVYTPWMRLRTWGNGTGTLN